LEEHFTVYYWDERGCGPASRRDAESARLARQIDDLGRWVAQIRSETHKDVTLMGISLGATAALLAASRGLKGVHAIVAISPDLKFPDIDLHVADYLMGKTAPRRQAGLRKLGPPPYLEPARFQQRARFLADAGALQRGRTFLSQAGELLLGLLGTYGLTGTLRSLRNMSIVQGRMLPELVELDLFPSLPKIAAPVHYLVSPQDPFMPPELLDRLSRSVTQTRQSLTTAPEACHLVHFDCPELVRSALHNYA
ncbi:MAG TPA: alpha/beta hydrolase, partial [Gammaproteobacteria bacterium]